MSFLHVFGIDPSDGGQPNGPLLLASDGNFFGTTRAGGPNVCGALERYPCGTVFRMKPNGDTSVLYAFGASASDGYSPSAPLMEAQDGALYGVTTAGGSHGAGTAFKITLDGVYSVLYSFGSAPSDGAVPTGGLVQASDGNFYGTTATGGANHCLQIPQAGGNCGTVFRMLPTGATTVIYSFGVSRADGVTPHGSLLQAGDGNLYGTTVNGGAHSCGSSQRPNTCGTVFRIGLDGVATVVHSFGATLAAGLAPQGALLKAADGALYGTTVSGGEANDGTIFRLTSDGTFSVLHAFVQRERAGGSGPSQYLLAGRDGTIYGTTGWGGTEGGGTVFKLTPAGAFSTLHSFGPLNVNPANPQGGLVEGRDGALYGVTFYNGLLGAVGARWGSGALFKVVIN